MILDFQQTTAASIGLVAQANRLLFAAATACRDIWNYDSDSAVISVFASPANCFAVPPYGHNAVKKHGVGGSSRGQLYHSL